jgi:hypothetical protein
MVVPALIFIACFGGGVLASTQWLPGIDRGPVGGVAFFAVCGLIGAGLGVVGLHVYEIAHELKITGLGGLTGGRGGILASGLTSMLLDGGTVFGLATVAYLLAPREDRPGRPGAAAEHERDR